MQGTAKWRDRYRDLPSPRRQYAEFVSTVDEKIGELLATLNQLNLREKTIVLVQSDHGHSTEARAFWGGGNAGPFRGAKACLFEGGIRVPSIVSMPGTIPADEIRDQMVFGCDWFPTIAELCQVQLPERHYDGKSLVPLLFDKQAPTPHEHLFWLLGSGKNPQWAVRQGKWKLLGNATDKTDLRIKVEVPDLFLANLDRDISEENNVAGKYPEVVASLTQIMREQMQSIEAANKSREEKR
jgi:arylsulfatase A-like enzyme